MKKKKKKKRDGSRPGGGARIGLVTIPEQPTEPSLLRLAGVSHIHAARIGLARDTGTTPADRSIFCPPGRRHSCRLVSELAVVSSPSRLLSRRRRLQACPVLSSSSCKPGNMWLDRFSAHSTPAGTPPPQGRAYSPAPRRPTRPSAPGLPPRSSSLTLLTPASSSSSLPSTARLPNGSARRPPNHGAPPDVPDPVQVLESILGAPLRTRATASAGVSEERSKPEEVVQDIDFGGLSLQQFVEAKAPTSQPSSPVHTRSAQTAEECTFLLLSLLFHAHVRVDVEEKDRFEDLHRSIAVLCPLLYELRGSDNGAGLR